MATNSLESKVLQVASILKLDVSKTLEWEENNTFLDRVLFSYDSDDNKLTIQKIYSLDKELIE